MVHPLLALCAGLALVTSLGSARAQDPRPVLVDSSPAYVSRVEFVLDGVLLHDGSLTSLVDVAPGRPLEPADIRTSIQRLVHRRQFASIDVEREQTPAGVVVRFVMTSLQRVVAYRFTRSLPIPSRELERMTRDRLGSAPTADRIPEAVEVVVAALGERGYLQPSLVTRIEPVDQVGNVRLVVDGQGGPRWVIGRIQVVGVTGTAVAGTLGALGLESGQPYDRIEIVEREARYLQQLRGEGYYEAVIRITPSPGTAARSIDLTVEVATGPRVTLSFTGDRLPADVRRVLVPSQEEGSVDEDLLEDSRTRIVEWLQERGHWRAAATYTRQGTDEALDIVFDVRAGRVYETVDVVLGGHQALADAEIRELLRLRVGQPFVPSALDASLAAIVAAYRDRGFPGARVEHVLVDASEPSLSPRARGRMEVRLRVVEGPEARVAALRFDGVSSLSTGVLEGLLSLRPGGVFSAAAVVADREAVLRRYLDEGYRQAQVETTLTPADGGRAIDVTFVVTEGPQIVVDRVIVVGNVRIDDEVIRRELQLEAGQPLGLSRVFESQRRLTALGLFRSIRITDVAQDGRPRRDVIVTVEEAPVTTIGYGAGLEGGQRLRSSAIGGVPGAPGTPLPGPTSAGIETRFELAPRGFFEVGRRNFLGKNRSVNLFLRGSLRPRDVPGDPERDGTGLALSEYRVLGTLREPRAVFASANLDVSAFTEQAIRSSFNFRRQAVRGELSRLVGDNTTVIARYGFGRTELFNARIQPEDQLSVDRLFPQVRLSSVSTSIIRDTRDDPLDPQRGHFSSVDGELAGRSIGSEVGFNKTYMQGFLYRRLGASRVVVAGGARLGLARGLPRHVPRMGDAAQAVLDPDDLTLVDVVRDLPASERFFAGGDSTVRGFALDRLGDTPTLDRNGLPSGGNALLVFNSELRVPVWRSVGMAAFVDAGNVFLRVADMDLASLRGATGVGLRYKSPIGPIRVDLGFKMTRRTFISGQREGRTALHITVGQAF